MLDPSVSSSVFSGASDSLNSARASRPVRISAPASRPSRESPVQSTKIFALMRYICSVLSQRAHDLSDRVAVLISAAEQRGFEQKADVRFADDLVVQQEIP